MIKVIGVRVFPEDIANEIPAGLHVDVEVDGFKWHTIIYNTAISKADLTIELQKRERKLKIWAEGRAYVFENRKNQHRNDLVD